MKFKLTIEGKTYEVEVAEQGGALDVTIDGRRVRVDVEEAKAAAVTAPAAAPVTPAPAAAPVAAPVVSAPAAPAAPGGGNVICPMAGVVLKLKVKPGDAVKRGDVVLILEAMKMENEIRAGADGKIGELKAAEGDRVNQGDLLCTII